MPIKRIIGGALIVIGLGLFGYFFFAPLSAGDRKILNDRADYGGNSATSPGLPKNMYLYGGLACCLIGGALLKK
jgi:hypothetical protein